MNILVFDIETVPDTEGGAKLLDLKWKSFSTITPP